MSTFNKYRTKGAYHWDWYETEDWYKQCVDECVKFCKGETLDVGCGDGLLLSKLPPGSMGIDPDPDAIRLAAQKGMEMKSIVESSVYTPVDRSFPYMACLNVIEHLDRPEVLKGVVRDHVTKGAIIITIDWQGGAFGEDHKHEYTYKELLEFFKEFKPEGFRLKDYPEWIGVKIRK